MTHGGINTNKYDCTHHREVRIDVERLRENCRTGLGCLIKLKNCHSAVYLKFHIDIINGYLYLVSTKLYDFTVACCLLYLSKTVCSNIVSEC